MKTMSQDLRTLFGGAGALGRWTDGQLLDVFLARREEAAFEELVNRHGPMVWGVCRRILHRHHDAEDAFQATFLVLARKGDAIVPRERLANWLYGVAVQTALKARTLILKRGERERQVMTMPEPAARRLSLAEDLDLGPWLDQELSRLPEKYRAPIVLCDLEGESYQAAAGRLGWPIGTLSGRLSRARALLARRLNRHGQVLTAATLTLALAEEGTAASPPLALVDSTARAATHFAGGRAATELISAQVIALAESVLTALVLSKVKVVVACVLMAGLVGLSLGGQVVTADVLDEQAAPERTEAHGGEPAKRIAKTVATPEADLEFLQGTWFGSVTEFGGQPLPIKPAGIPPQVQLIFKGDRLRFRGPALDKTISFGTIEEREFTLKLGGEANRLTIDLTLSPVANDEPPLTYRGIYSLWHGHLVIGLNAPGQKRPKDFKTEVQRPRWLLDLNLAVLSDYESNSVRINSPIKDLKVRNRNESLKSLEDRKKQAISRNRELFGDR
ncbi:sigma-70 family RNA polymerase sigma factor [Singulisphaera acidiphila]|uniref:RNA polymerase sigma factor, sigma-70 family n=1 Tax=Singulisphaera acidiphila (strain ATCC BAA-1392 / DSM 18658 / VKM B-2454 / MOB10) TaxID=886293 RepID=L0DIV6_SINAD|nr:sigma-70 family RNA polymerase sigma factor [Singulisphaera acidiphila]AGA28748.1 RNA polymerase sigma factor, sigma-70 family [Singulisphaera acidiphila DSM 18658]